MACLKPNTVWWSAEVNKNGSRSIVFDVNKALDWSQEFKIACGQCLGCRVDNAKNWGIRGVHESQMWDHCSFVTYTFDTPSLETRENPWSIDYREIQQVHKNMRKKYGPFRFLLCGEYGEKNHRPHYHGIYFGLGFADKEPIQKIYGNQYYTSPSLEKSWGNGFVAISDVTFDSIAYVARYATKKLLGQLAKPDCCPDPYTGEFTKNSHYSYIDEETGEIRDRNPETLQCSNKPGIGKDFFEKYYKEIYPRDEVVINGKTLKPPRYYDNLLKEKDYDLYQSVREKRLANAQIREDNDTDDYLRKWQIMQAKTEYLTQSRDKC